MKKIIAILITLVLSLQMTVVLATGAPNVSVATVVGKAGDVVDVTVTLANNVEFTSLGIEVDYDSTALTLQSVAAGPVGTGMIASQTVAVKPYVMQWNPSPDNSTYNGVLATLKFKISDTAEAGTYPISVSFSNPNGTFVDGVSVNFVFDWLTFMQTPIGLTYTSGAVTVESDAPAGPSLSATCADGKNVAVTATGVEAGGKFIATLYNGNEMTDMVIADAVASTTLTFTEGTGNMVKVMWWDGLTTLSPIVTPVEITLGN